MSVNGYRDPEYSLLGLPPCLDPLVLFLAPFVKPEQNTENNPLPPHSTFIYFLVVQAIACN